jgi:hypothetical protein
MAADQVNDQLTRPIGMQASIYAAKSGQGERWGLEAFSGIALTLVYTLCSTVFLFRSFYRLDKSPLENESR